MPAESDNGLGWGLTLLDTMLHEYAGGFSRRAIADALDVPLQQCFALYAAAASRHGNKPAGPSYKDRALMRALSAAKS